MNGAAVDFYVSKQDIAYPFENHLSDGLEKLFVDAAVMQTVDRVQVRVRLASFNPAGTCTLYFEDGTLLAVLTGADNFISSSFGNYTMYQWIRSSTIGAGFTGADIVVRFVVVTARLSNYSYPISPSNAYLLSSLVDPKPIGIRRAAMALPGQPCCLFGGIDDKPLILQAGYNVQLSLSTPQVVPLMNLASKATVRPQAAIVVNAAPGSGRGVYPGCTNLNVPLTQINQTGPDVSGNFALAGADCTWAEMLLNPVVIPPVNPNTDYKGSILPATYELHAQCKACCSCEDYYGAYGQLRGVYLRAAAAAANLEKLREEYNTLCEEINAFKAKVETGLGVKLEVDSRPDYHVTAMATAYNNSASSIGRVKFIFSFSSGLTNPVYTPQSGLVNAANARNLQMNPQQSGSSFSFTVAGLAPGAYATYLFQVRYTHGVRNGIRVGVSVEAVSSLSSATDTKSIILQPPLEKL